MRRHAKRDANHRQIAQALRQCGAMVFDAGAVGDVFPDLVCLFRGQIVLFEIKSGPGQTLTPGEREFHRQWSGGPIHIVTGIDDAVNVLNGDRRDK